MIQLEKEIETGLRTAIRASLNTYGVATPELVDAKITTFWLGDEDGGDADDASNLRVELMARPNSSNGWMGGSTGLEPMRTVTVDVMCVSMPDSDRDRRIIRALYEAVRVVFETSPVVFTFAVGITFGGMLIANGGAAEFDDGGQVAGFSVELKVSL